MDCNLLQFISLPSESCYTVVNLKLENQVRTCVKAEETVLQIEKVVGTLVYTSSI